MDTLRPGADWDFLGEMAFFTATFQLRMVYVGVQAVWNPEYVGLGCVVVGHQKNMMDFTGSSWSKVECFVCEIGEIQPESFGILELLNPEI